MKNFRLHPAADAEAIAEASYIKADDPAQGELFVAALEKAILQARSDPLRYRCFEGEFRKVRVGKFRYLLIYRDREDEIQILAVAHMSRRPGYWKKRAKNWP